MKSNLERYSSICKCNIPFYFPHVYLVITHSASTCAPVSEKWGSCLSSSIMTSLLTAQLSFLLWPVMPGPHRFPLVTGKAWDHSDNGHSAFFHSVYNFAVQVLSRMGFSGQWTFKAVGKHNLHGIQEKREVQTSLSQLYTEFKMFIIFSFSDSDTSTKSMRYPRGWHN